jgi:ferredoxin--NADP+ reductase
MQDEKYFVAVIGAGPAGLYAARKLALSGAEVVLFNRDIKPGGLAEYGIYHSKYRMKNGLRKQFNKILAEEGISYYGNVSVGENGDLSLDDVRAMGFQAILVTVGAQGTKWLGLPGEDLCGVYHAKDLVYHYNKLPPYSEREFAIGKKVALVGMGNVMIDIAHWLIHKLKVDEVISVARRGPSEVKFTKKEMAHLACDLSLDDLDAEIGRSAERMNAIGQDPQDAKDYILSTLPPECNRTSYTLFRLRFLSSPKEIVSDENGGVRGLKVEDTKLTLKNGEIKAESLGTTRLLDADTVVFCIGDKVDDEFGLPVQWNAFVKNPEPHFPVNELSYEIFDPQANQPVEGVFVAGWSREASSGLVGYARKDGENGAQAVLQYLAGQPPVDDSATLLADVTARLQQLPHPVVDKSGLARLAEVESAQAEELGLEEFKFGANDEMLGVLAMV